MFKRREPKVAKQKRKRKRQPEVGIIPKGYHKDESDGKEKKKSQKW